MHLAVIPPAESWHLHLLAVTADGRRVFCTTRVRRRPPAAQLAMRTCITPGQRLYSCKDMPRPPSVLGWFPR